MMKDYLFGGSNDGEWDKSEVILMSRKDGHSTVCDCFDRIGRSVDDWNRPIRIKEFYKCYNCQSEDERRELEEKERQIREYDERQAELAERMRQERERASRVEQELRKTKLEDDRRWAAKWQHKVDAARKRFEDYVNGQRIVNKDNLVSKLYDKKIYGRMHDNTIYVYVYGNGRMDRRSLKYEIKKSGNRYVFKSCGMCD